MRLCRGNTYILIFLLTFASSLCLGSEKKQRFLEYGKKMPTNLWRQSVEYYLKESLCEKKSFYIKCYAVNKNKCQKTIGIGLIECWRHLPLRSKYIKPHLKRALKLSKKLGQCVGKEYHKKWKNLYSTQRVCQTSEGWL